MSAVVQGQAAVRKTDVSKLVVDFGPAGSPVAQVASPTPAGAAEKLESCASEVVRSVPLANAVNPLRQFSLIDSSDELQRLAQAQTPLLGDFCLKGQATVLYAKPNVGKTLVCMCELPAAVRDGRLSGPDAYYIDADDTPTGVIEKIAILRPYGIHVLAPGLRGFEARDLPKLLQKMAKEGTAQNSFILTDTLKKFVELMDKRESSGFAENVRQFVMAGGTFLGLAHTNKRLDKDGKPIFAGTSDILDDFDCAYTIVDVGSRPGADERIVQFDCIKARGNVPQQIAYSYSLDRQLTYEQRVQSMRVVDSASVSLAQAQVQADRDEPYLAIIEQCIGEGIQTKTDLQKEAALRTKIGRHLIGQLIDRYCGDDPARHRWTFDTGGHGRRDYRLIGQARDGPVIAPGTVF